MLYLGICSLLYFGIPGDSLVDSVLADIFSDPEMLVGICPVLYLGISVDFNGSDESGVSDISDESCTLVGSG